MTESTELEAMLRRVTNALVRRANTGDLDALAALNNHGRYVDGATIAAGRALHYDAPDAYSWETIGTHLGVTRQAAARRFNVNTPLTTLLPQPAPCGAPTATTGRPCRRLVPPGTGHCPTHRINPTTTRRTA